LSTARPSVNPLQTVPFGTGLTLHRTTLRNGLKLLMLPDATAPVLSFHLWYGVGSRHAKAGKTGISHLFEHLMFNETRKLPAGELDRLIEARGGSTNASTWVDWTHYHTDLPAGELDFIARIEAERMHHLVLNDAALTSEKDVVMNERRFRVDDDIEGTVGEKLYSLAFTRHPYRIPTIGHMRDIKGFTRKDCEQFYKTYYAPNNATMIIAGDLKPKQALACIEKHFGKLKPARIPAPRKVVEPAQRAERTAELRWPTPTAKIVLGYKSPAFPDEAYGVLTVLNEALFGGRGSRMWRRLVHKTGLCADVQASPSPFADVGLYEMSFSLRQGAKVREVLRVVDEELRDIQRTPMSEAELSKVKNRLELGFLLGLESAYGKAEQAGFFEVVAGDATGLFTRLETYRTVTAKELQSCARTLLNKSTRTRVTVLPKGGRP
jgi:zinc protease